MSEKINSFDNIKKHLFKFDHVTGVGIGNKSVNGIKTDEKAIVVLVENKQPKSEIFSRLRISEKFDGIVTDIVAIGRIYAHSFKERQRPFGPGVSMAHIATKTGTLGAFVRDVDTNEILLLSNNHVFAHCNKANPGDAILQPCVNDGGNPETDIVAHLKRYVPLKLSGVKGEHKILQRFNKFLELLLIYSGTSSLKIYKSRYGNYVDAAVAKPIAEEIVANELTKKSCIETASCIVGTLVKKYGRSTGLTQGNVKYLNMDIRIELGDGRTAFMMDQIVTSSMSKYGDSGALLMDMNNCAVGLLCGGSDKVSVANPISTVLNLLNVRFGE